MTKGCHPFSSARFDLLWITTGKAIAALRPTARAVREGLSAIRFDGLRMVCAAPAGQKCSNDASGVTRRLSNPLGKLPWRRTHHLVGDGNVKCDLLPSIAEDFTCFLERMPCAYIWIGNGDA